MHDCLRRFIVGHGADPVLSTSPFDVMFARKLFDDSGYAAGVWFQRLYRYHAGRCRLRGMLDDGKYAADTAPEDPRRDAEYQALVSDRRVTGKGLDSVAGVVVFHEVPRWLTALVSQQMPSVEDIAARNEFIIALAAIRAIWLEFGKETTETLQARAKANRSAGLSLAELPRRGRRIVDP